MAKYSDVIAGLSVFLKLEGDRYNLSAGHDVLYAGPDSEALNEDLKKQLTEWGWKYDKAVGSWRIFV